MDDSETNQDRDRQVRRTASARRGMVAAGTVGALGAAIGIGVSTQVADPSGSTSGTVTQEDRAGQDPGSADDEDDFQQDDDHDTQKKWDQPPSGGELATPGGGGPAQGQSGGS